MRTSVRAERAMATIGLAVGVAAAVAPGRLQRVFGIPSEQVATSADLGWRLFATRNLYLGGLALAGDRQAVAAFLPLQLLDQVVFWHAFVTRSVPRRTSVGAAATSGAIIGLDLVRRRTGQGGAADPSGVAARALLATHELPQESPSRSHRA